MRPGGVRWLGRNFLTYLSAIQKSNEHNAWLEFDVDNVERATAELESMGYSMLIKNEKEPWGQTISRFLDSDGLLVGLTFTPSLREKKHA